MNCLINEEVLDIGSQEFIMGVLCRGNIEKLYRMQYCVGISIKFLLELGYMLRLTSIPLDGPALMLSDNMSVVSVVLNTTVP